MSTCENLGRTVKRRGARDAETQRRRRKFDNYKVLYKPLRGCEKIEIRNAFTYLFCTFKIPSLPHRSNSNFSQPLRLLSLLRLSVKLLIYANVICMSKIRIKGAGIQGLTCAWALRDLSPELYEAKSVPGGWIQTRVIDNFLFELGPRGFRPKGDGLYTLQLIRELGLEEELIAPPASASIRYIYLNGRLQALPHSLSSWFTPLGYKMGKGILRDLVMPQKKAETIQDYFSHRFGKDFTSNIVDPGVRGVFGGDISKLSFANCFPDVHKIASHNRSLILGMLKKKKAPQDPKWSKYPLLSFKQGMGTLIEALSKHFTIHTSTPLQDADIDCTTNHPSASIAVVNLGYREKFPVKGFGYLVPSHLNEPIMGCIFDSETFPQQNNHPEETRLTVMVGGTHQPHLLNHPDLIGLVQKTLYRHIGIKIEPQAAQITLCQNAIPQYGILDNLKGIGINDACLKGYQKGASYASSTSRASG